MKRNLTGRIRSTAVSRGPQTHDRPRTSPDVNDEGSKSASEFRLGRWGAVLRRIGISCLLLLGLAAVHFFGFLSVMPQGIQRLVATTFGPEFSAVFVYYVALSLLFARLGTYSWAAATHWWTSRKELGQARQSPRHMRRYLRASRQNTMKIDWPIPILAPFFLAVLYADEAIAATSLALILLAFFVLCATTVPRAALAPIRFFKRIRNRRSTSHRLRAGVELYPLVVVALLAVSFYLGKARFERLANERPTPIHSSAYTGQAVVLAQTEKAMLVLEQCAAGTHRRYILVMGNSLVSEVMPHGSDKFKPLPGPTPPPRGPALNEASSSAKPLSDAACQA